MFLFYETGSMTAGISRKGATMIVQSSTKPRDSLPIMAAVIIGGGMSHMGTSTMPLQIGALMDGRGLDASTAGLFGFFEIGALSLAMIVISRFAQLSRPVVVGMVGSLLALIGNAAVYGLDLGVPALLLCGALAGLGYGFVFSAVVTVAAASHNPDRLYAICNGGGVVFVVAVMLLIPSLGAGFGNLGAFAVSATVILVTAPVMLSFRRYASPVRADTRETFAERPSVIALLLLWSSFSLGTAALWSFAERIGRSLQLPSETIGVVLSSATIFGVLGTVVAAALAGRIPRMLGLGVGLVATGVACAILGFSAGIVSYAIGVGLYWILYMFQYSVFLGAAAALDSTGRAGTLGAGCERLAFAVGAPVGGFIVDHLSFPALGLLGFACCVVTIPFCLPLVNHGLRRLAMPRE